MPAARQAACWRSADSTTARVMWRIRPCRSPIGRKASGASRPCSRVLPAHERLDAVDRAALEVGLRLVVEDELAALDRAAQLAGELDVAARDLVVLVVEQLDAGAAVLGAVHRDVGAPQQRRAVVAVVGDHGDADARGRVAEDPVELHRRGERALDRGGRRLGVRRRRVPGGSRTTNSSPPSRATDAPGARPVDSRPPTSSEQLVAGAVAERVVELLEVVEVHQQQRGGLARGGQGRELPPELGVEAAAVREPRELVGPGLRCCGRARSAATRRRRSRAAATIAIIAATASDATREVHRAARGRARARRARAARSRR